MIIYEKNCLINITTNTNRERKQINESQAFIYIYKAPNYQNKRKKKGEEQYKEKHPKRHDLVRWTHIITLNRLLRYFLLAPFLSDGYL